MEREINIDKNEAADLLAGTGCPPDCEIGTGEMIKTTDGAGGVNVSCYECGMCPDLDNVKIVYEADTTDKQVEATGQRRLETTVKFTDPTSGSTVKGKATL